MNYNILNYIVTIAEEKNFTKAANRLFISQPSLSQIVKKEENRIGVSLFDRSITPIELTEAGKEYLLWAKQILNGFDNMNKSLNDYKENERQILSIGILPEFCAFILANPLKEFRDDNKKILVNIKELSSSDLIKSLEKDEFDFIVGLTHKDKYKYISEPLCDENIVLASSLNTKLPNKKGVVDLKDLSEEPFIIMDEGQFLYNVTYDLCKNAGFIPKPVVECYNLDTALEMVKAGVGISIVPDLIASIHGDIKYYRINDITPQSQISIVYSRTRYLSKKNKELINLIKKHFNVL